MATSTHGHKYTPAGSMETILVPVDDEKTLDFCMRHLNYDGKIDSYFKFSDLGMLKGFINKAKTIKTHVILKCSGCNSCEEK